MKKPDMKKHLYGLIYMKCPGKKNLLRWKLDLWLLTAGVGGGGNRVIAKRYRTNKHVVNLTMVLVAHICDYTKP